MVTEVLNRPLASVWAVPNELGAEWKVNVTVAFGVKFWPETVVELPAGPELGLAEMLALPYPGLAFAAAGARTETAAMSAMTHTRGDRRRMVAFIVLISPSREPYRCGAAWGAVNAALQLRSWNRRYL
jgi:hypothetical protein